MSSTGVTDDEVGGERLPLLAALDEVHALADRLARVTSPGEVWRSRDVDVLTAVGELARVRAALDAVHLALVREVDSRGVAEASPVATSVAGFLQSACLVNRGQAARDVAAARATAPGAELEGVGEALAAGRCARAHVDVAVRCLEQLPRHLLESAAARSEVCDYLLLAVTEATPREADRAARDLLRTLAPDPADRQDPQAHERRFLDVHVDGTGMTTGRFQLDPVAGAHLQTALDRWSAPEPGTDGERDARQPRQRRADALSTALETALSVQGAQRGERPRVVVHVTPEQLTASAGAGAVGAGCASVEGGAQLPGWAARRLACDAVLQRLVTCPREGVLELGRTQRLASLTQRRALAARDQGCVVPGCHATPAFCDAHHVRFWADGGPTDLGNLVLLCPAHHTAVHAGTWHVDIEPDTQQVWVTPPRWRDPRRTPRPAWRQRAERTRRRLSEQLTCHPTTRPPDQTTGEPTDEPGVVGFADLFALGPPPPPGPAERARQDELSRRFGEELDRLLGYPAGT